MKPTRAHNSFDHGEKRLTDLVPLHIIRTETVFSKFPIHTLSKKGRIDIHLISKTKTGETDFEWKVSPHPEFGIPRQLAYKLDTVVVNRKIDETSRPLPEILRIGSLREICQEMDLKENGRTLDKIKKAFLQNAHTVITAKLDYKGRDHTSRRVAASNNKLLSFTRYSVAFTGTTLPSGEKADAVYIILNPPYREVLNNAPARPLNYDYLKKLTPAPQRFYELISRSVFATIKYGLPHAKLRYSEYCRHAPQQRYYDYDHFKKQMYKVHRPHLQSGYLGAVSYEATTCSEGKSDWMMLYSPGPKADAEYRTLNKRRLIETATRAELGPENSTDADTSNALTGEGAELLRYFHKRARGDERYAPQPGGREHDLALELLHQHGPERARFIIDFGVEEAKTTRFRMRTFGALIQYVAEALDAWERREQSREQQRQYEVHEQERRQHDEEARQRKIGQLNNFQRDFPQDYQTLFEAEKVKFLRWLPMAAKWKPEDLEQAVRSGMMRELEQRQHNAPMSS
jgi:hypothetical protein